MKILVYLMTLVLFSTAVAQNPTIVTGNYITNVFGNSNFVLNPNAQTGTTNVTNATRSTTTPLVATSEFTLNLTSGTFATWTLRAFDSGMKGQNCEARFSYRGFATATTKAEIVQNSLVVAHLTLTPSTDPRIASINFPCGDLANATTFRIAQTTANMTGTNEIGAIYTGLATNMANVAQAEAVLIATRATAQAVPSGAGTTDIVFNTEELDALDEWNTSTGIFTAKRAGFYAISAEVLLTGATGWAVGELHELIVLKGISGVYSQIQSNRIEVEGTLGTALLGNAVEATVQLAVGETLKIGMTQTNGASINLEANAKHNRVQIKRFPTSSELVVTPERQNTFGGVNFNGSGFIQSQSISASTWAKLTYQTAITRNPYGKAFVETNNDISVTIKSLPVGTFRVVANGLMRAIANGSGNMTSCAFGISDSATPTNPIIASHANAVGDATSTTQDAYVSTAYGVFTNTSVQDKTFFVVSKRVQGLGTCSLGTNSGDYPFVLSVEPLDQPSNSALYVQGPVLGANTGAAIPAGYVGELKQASSAGSIAAGATATPKTYANLTLESGVWLCSAAVTFNCSVSANCIDPLVNLSGVNNSLPAVDGLTIGIWYPQTGWGFQSSGVTPQTIRSTGSSLIFPDGTTSGSNILYAVARLTYPSGSPLINGKVNCTRLN